MVEKKKINDPNAELEAQKYENPIPSRLYILDFLAEKGSPITYLELQEALMINDADRQEALRRRLIAMVRDGQLLKNRRGAYGLPAKMELIAGRIVGHKDGFGFVEPDEGGHDLFVSPRQMRGVFHGDRVLVRVASIDTRGRREAIIVEVLEHNTKQLVGRFYAESGTAYVEPSNQRINQEVLIPPHAQGGAKHGQMVVVALTEPPTMRSRALGEIIEVLGDHMAPGMEINVAIRNHELPYRWPEDALLEAGKYEATVPAAAITHREDLRDLSFVTIDGEDAKDFDDAVLCVPRPKGGWTLYVAIADVSHYVRPKTALDSEAYRRGNSVYFPGRVIPMLPEVLSNNLCSLNPLVDRLVMVCQMTIQASGKISRYQFSEAVIKSAARLTYREVHMAMEKKDKRTQTRLAPLMIHLENLYALYAALKKARENRGAIDFDMPETKIVFGRNRKIEKIIPYERYVSHRVIEECMLSANICTAKYLQKMQQPALYRIHEGPRAEKLKDLQRFLHELGIKMRKHEEVVPADYAAILEAIQDRPDKHMIQTVLLRSMSQAVYAAENKGHFGLAYDAYTHFTSPIRRYPDLLVHRAIKEALAQKKPHTKVQLDEFSATGEHCSMTERRADDATHEVIDWLKCEFMMDKIGKEFAGVIAGVTSFGIFVELQEVYVEGLVHISTLPDDYYHFDPIKHALVGEHSARRYRLGDSIKIKVARVSLDDCQIDFELIEEKKLSHKNKNNKKMTKSKKNKKSNKNKI